MTKIVNEANFPNDKAQPIQIRLELHVHAVHDARAGLGANDGPRLGGAAPGTGGSSQSATGVMARIAVTALAVCAIGFAYKVGGMSPAPPPPSAATSLSQPSGALLANDQHHFPAPAAQAELLKDLQGPPQITPPPGAPPAQTLSGPVRFGLN
ncbi:hypothetical protein [Methylocapsa palsarum]|uniref:Uncharacterized protein n=1 Tax=Methylocapsa palsarum TaxID=1612308 RepID=A0A1I4CKH8_9HYPH|nr:hypothetical protein [Methylocapsa palsarum]SFK80789.1 hypothetical protein SAMN05444581_1233 [Methylocapsa palsarum]